MPASMNALLWEQWRRTRWGWLAVLAASTVVSLYCAWSHNLPRAYWAGPELSEDFRTYVLILYMMLLFLPLDGSDVKLGLPRYMMTLPCRTATLAKSQLRYGLLSIALLASANEGMAQWFLDDARIELVLLTLSIGAALYAIFWTIGIVAPRPTLFIATAFAITAVFSHHILWQNEYAPALILIEIFVAATAVPIARWGVRLDRNGELAPGMLDRRGDPPGVFPWRIVHSRLLHRYPGLRPMFWLEWKRTYRWIPISSACITVFGVLYLVAEGFPRREVPNVGALICLGVPLVMCGITGLLRDTWDYQRFRSGVPSPEYSLPVSDRTLVTARWLAGFAAISLTGAIVGTLQLAITLSFWGLDIIRTWDIAAIPLLVVYYMTLCWVLLWISPLVMVAALVIAGSLPPKLAIIILGSAVIAGWLFGVARMVIRPGAVSMLRALTLMLLCLAVFYFTLGRTPLAEISPILALAICLTFILTPLAVHTKRHCA